VEFFNSRDAKNKAALKIESDILKDLNLSTGSNIDGDPDIQKFMRLARIKIQTTGKPNRRDEKCETEGLTSRQLDGTETLE
jgi:hypothetical protein